MNFGGFSTASGKAASVSAVALEKARKILAETDSDTVCVFPEKNNFGSSVSNTYMPLTPAQTPVFLGSNRRIKRDSDAPIASNNVVETCAGMHNFNEFSTASGRAEVFSEAALLKAHKLLEEIKDGENPTTSSVDFSSRSDATPVFQGFSTASGRTEKVSESALAKARQRFEQTNEEDPGSSPSAFQFSKRTLSRPVGEPNSSIRFGGFATASGRTENVSEKALLKARQIFEETVEESSSSPSSKFVFPRKFREPGNHSASEKLSSVSVTSSFLSSVKDSSRKPSSSFYSMDKRNTNFPPARSVDFVPPSVTQVENKDTLPLKARKLFSESSPFAPSPISRNSSAQTSSSGRRKSGVTELLRKRARIDSSRDILSDKISEDFGSTTPILRKSASDAKIKLLKQQETRKTYSDSEIYIDDDGRLSPIFNSSPALSSFKTSPTHFFDARTDLPQSMQATPVLISPANVSGFPKFLSRRKPFLGEGNSAKSKSMRPFVSPACSTPRLKRESLYKAARQTGNVVRKCGKVMELRKNGKSWRLDRVLSGLTPEPYSANELLGYGVARPTLEISASNAANFYFTADYFDNTGSVLQFGDGLEVSLDSDGGVSAAAIAQAFLAGPYIDFTLISGGWVLNHYRWIVYKLAALEVAFPLFFAGKQLTLDRVGYQLKYRYDKEIDGSERSALRRILEGDDTIARPMLVFVSNINNVVTMAEEEGKATKFSAEISDGWYSLRAELDCFLSAQIRNGNIVVGTKLFLLGVSLQGFQEGHHPLEVPDSVYVQLDVNCVRRARWNARLGFYKGRTLPRFSLISLFPNGGIVSAQVPLTVSKVFPIQFIEKYPDGRVTFRYGKEEGIAAAQFERFRMAAVERIVESVCKISSTDELDSQMSQDIVNQNGEEQDWSSGEGLYSILRKTKDPGTWHAALSDEKVELLNRFLMKRRDLQIEGFRSKVEAAMKEREDEIPKRSVRTQLKVLVRGTHPADTAVNAGAVLTVYSPGEELLDLLKEGSSFLVNNLMVYEHRKSAFESSDLSVDSSIVIRLSASKSTYFCRAKDS